MAAWLAVGALSASSGAELVLDSVGVQLYLQDGHLCIKRGGSLVTDLKSIEFNFTAPISLKVAARAEGCVTLRAVYPSVANYRDEQRDLPVDIQVSLVAGGFRFLAHPEWALNTTVRLGDLDDHFFGVLEPLYPNNHHSPDLRGQVVDVEAVGARSLYHESFASIWSAFFMTAHGYASFFDTFAKGRYSLGVGGETELHHCTGLLDWYLFFGRDGDELLAAYYGVIGAPKPVPLWALGPIGWRDENKGGAVEILEDVRRMTELRIPFTAWWVDRPYCEGSNAWSKMNFGPQFANPGDWIARLAHDYDLKFMSWVGPMTFGDPDFPGLLPGAPNYLDLSDPAAVHEFERRLATQQYAFGVRGHKMDRGEERFPENARWKDGTTENESRNKYLYLYAKATHEILTRAWGADHCNFARGAYHRSQPYLTAVWGGDSRSSWDGLAGSLANCIRCSFMGFPVWGADTGGYLGGRIDEELYARWLQWGAWSGLFEIKLDDADRQAPDRPPWAYGERLQAAFRVACQQRMQLLPYLHSLANTSGRNGVLMKPLAYVWPQDPATHAVWDEYLLGSAFLVAPLTAPGGQRSIYLPAGAWYDFYEPARTYAGCRTIQVTAPFERIPVFVRANSLAVTGVLPLGNMRDHTNSLVRPSFTVRATPGQPGETAHFDLVDSFDDNRVKTLGLERTADEVRLSIPPLGAAGVLQICCDMAPKAVTFNGHTVPFAHDRTTHIAQIPFTAGEAVELRVALRESKPTLQEHARF